MHFEQKTANGIDITDTFAKLLVLAVVSAELRPGCFEDILKCFYACSFRFTHKIGRELAQASILDSLEAIQKLAKT